jgi:formate hydrogenlyase subunit 6/NADH:ubiquinone oxidoreductase subunit I
MGLKAYLNDIVEAVVTTAKGMRITARYGVDPREEVTLQYPEERWEIPQGYRGFLHNDIKTCTACTMCVKTCPVDCISLESVRGADKKMVLASYDINIGRCMYCGLCVEVCPPKSLKHTSGYEMASVTRGELILHFIAEDAAEIKARVALQVAEAAAKAEAQAAAKAAEVPSLGTAETAKATEAAKAEAQPAAKAEAQVVAKAAEVPSSGTAEVPSSGTAEPDAAAAPKPAEAQAAAKAAEVPSLGTEPTPAPEKKE